MNLPSREALGVALALHNKLIGLRDIPALPARIGRNQRALGRFRVRQTGPVRSERQPEKHRVRLERSKGESAHAADHRRPFFRGTTSSSLAREPAGLTAGYLLPKDAVRTTILEADDIVGRSR
jgi:hypothetical protein